MKRTLIRAAVALAALVVVAAALAPAARAQVPPETSPETPQPGERPLPSKKIGPKEDWISFYPVPVIYSDPNIGPGFGVMPVALIEPANRIEWLFAPSIDYNRIVGTTFASRVFWYPTRAEDVELTNSASTGPNLEQELVVHTVDRTLEVPSNEFARGYYMVDATRRFFGFEDRSRTHDQTDYKLSEYGAEGELDWRFRGIFRIGPTARYRHAQIGVGIVRDLPQTTFRFPNIQGIDQNGVDILAYGGHATIDTRDDPAIPNEGLLADAYVEMSARGVISDTRFERWGVSATHHLPILRPGIWVSVLHVRYAGIDGDPFAPFWEFPTLGGPENLRGFGLGRFTDERYIVFSAEERVRFLDTVILDKELVFEAAPFLDAGRVFGPGDSLSTEHWQLVPGAGMRMLLPDSAIVARMDVGLSMHEGPAVFLVLGYPF